MLNYGVSAAGCAWVLSRAADSCRRWLRQSPPRSDPILAWRASAVIERHEFPRYFGESRFDGRKAEYEQI